MTSVRVQLSVKWYSFLAKLKKSINSLSKYLTPATSNKKQQSEQQEQIVSFLSRLFPSYHSGIDRNSDDSIHIKIELKKRLFQTECLTTVLA